MLKLIVNCWKSWKRTYRARGEDSGQKVSFSPGQPAATYSQKDPQHNWEFGLGVTQTSTLRSRLGTVWLPSLWTSQISHERQALFYRRWGGWNCEQMNPSAAKRILRQRHQWLCKAMGKVCGKEWRLCGKIKNLNLIQNYNIIPDIYIYPIYIYPIYHLTAADSPSYVIKTRSVTSQFCVCNHRTTLLTAQENNIIHLNFKSCRNQQWTTKTIHSNYIKIEMEWILTKHLSPS